MLAFMRYVYIYCVYIYIHTHIILYIYIHFPSIHNRPKLSGLGITDSYGMAPPVWAQCARHSPHASSWANPSGLWSLGGLGAWDKKHDRQQIPVLLSCSLKRQKRLLSLLRESTTLHIGRGSPSAKIQKSRLGSSAVLFGTPSGFHSPSAPSAREFGRQGTSDWGQMNRKSGDLEEESSDRHLLYFNYFQLRPSNIEIGSSLYPLDDWRSAPPRTLRIQADWHGRQLVGIRLHTLQMWTSEEHFTARTWGNLRI